MRPLRIGATNLRTWAELDLELEAGITAIVGPNGAGKSSLVQTIELALFGKGRELKRLATRGAEVVEVELVFEHGGAVYRIVRGYSLKGRGKPHLIFVRQHEDGRSESLDRETIDETEAELEKILGLSRRTFRASSFLAQGDGAAFTEAEPRERKAIILDALGVHVWDRLRDEAAARRLEEERDLAGLVARCEAIEGQVALRDGAVAAKLAAEQTATALSDTVAELEEAVQRRRHELEEAIASGAARTELEAKATAALQAVADRRAAARQELEHRESAIDAKSQEAERMAALERQEDELESRFKADLDRLVEELAEVEAEKGRVEAGNARCPTCSQALRGEPLDRAIAAVRARLSAVVERQGETLGRAQEAARRREAAGEEVSRLNAEVQALMSERLARKAALMLEVAELENAAEDAQAALAEHEGPDVDRLRRELVIAEDHVRRRRAELETARATFARDSERLEAIDRAKALLDELATQRRRSARRVEILKLGERAFGRDGVPALILEAAAIPQLEGHANEVVAKLGRDYRFELRTLRATQAGAAKEALDVVVHTATGEALYEDFSGGERTRLDLALRIALARLLASRRGADVRALVVDEPAYLDEDGFLALAAVLRSLAGEFDTILVVSHVEALRDAFDSAIIVGGGADTGEPSRLEEVS